jgi:hypothetical protein
MTPSPSEDPASGHARGVSKGLDFLGLRIQRYGKRGTTQQRVYITCPAKKVLWPRGGPAVSTQLGVARLGYLLPIRGVRLDIPIPVEVRLERASGWTTWKEIRRRFCVGWLTGSRYYLVDRPHGSTATAGNEDPNIVDHHDLRNTAASAYSTYCASRVTRA